MAFAIIVDDDPDLLTLLKIVLETEGYSVIQSSNAVDAMELLKAQPCDIAILDYMMPDTDGLSLARLIQKAAPNTVMFMLSAYLTRDLVIEAFRAGVRDCFIKPIDGKLIRDRIKTVQTQHQQYVQRLKNWLTVTRLIDDLRTNGDMDIGAEPTNKGEKNETGILVRGRIRYDSNTRWVYVDGQNMVLPPTTGEYLAVLMRKSPNPVTYEDLVNLVQGTQLSRNEARDQARWQVFKLRQLIEADAKHPQMIITLRNIGFKLIA
jgi:DNA-binding response OmpR family regulator